MCVQPYGKLVTMIYLKVSLSDFLTLFSARTEVRRFAAGVGSCLLLASHALPAGHRPHLRGLIRDVIRTAPHLPPLPASLCFCRAPSGRCAPASC